MSNSQKKITELRGKAKRYFRDVFPKAEINYAKADHFIDRLIDKMITKLYEKETN